MKKILILILILSHFCTSLFAQQSVGLPLNIISGQVGDSGMASNSSFGSKTTPTAPAGFESPRTSLLQEQTYGGLTYQVHILGEVGKAGTYRIPASTRLSEALEKAGGVQERGSLRRIEIRRGQELGSAGKLIKVDLFQFKQNGNLNDNPYLLDNDVVYVPLRGKVVQVVGTVMRPGTYELLGEKTLEDVIKFVGGFSPAFQKEAPLKVIRYTGGNKKLIDVENTEESKRAFIVENSDVIVAPNFLIKDKKFDYNLPYLPGDGELFIPSFDNRVYVLGAVFQPGPKSFAPYYGVRQYLTLAGGTTKLAKSRRVRVVRVDGKSVKAKSDTIINPGDTIVVPEKYLPPEGLLSLVLGLTTSVLGITTTILTLSK